MEFRIFFKNKNRNLIYLYLLVPLFEVCFTFLKLFYYSVYTSNCTECTKVYYSLYSSMYEIYPLFAILVATIYFISIILDIVFIIRRKENNNSNIWLLIINLFSILFFLSILFFMTFTNKSIF